MTKNHHIVFQSGIFILFLLLSSPSHAGDCIVYAGAGLKRPMAELAKDFEAETAHQIDINYGGAGHLFGMMAMGHQCDVFIPGARRYVDIAVEKGWIRAEKITPLVKHEPAIAVPHDNPGKIQNLYDLAEADIKLALGDPRACAIGNLSVKILKKNGIYEAAMDQTRVYGPTVNQLLLYVITGKVDAAIIWADLGRWPESSGDVRLIKISASQNIIRHIPVAVTVKGEHNFSAEAFAAYLGSSKGLNIWRKWGFDPCSSSMSSN